MVINWSVFWTAIATIFGILGPFMLWAMRNIKKYRDHEINLVRQENERIRQELDTRLQLPSYGLDAVMLTELAAERRIDELEEKHKKAVSEKDEQLAKTINKQKQHIVKLSTDLNKLQSQQLNIKQDLQGAIVTKAPVFQKNAIGLPTGLILLIHHAGKYGAVQAIEQAKMDRGAFIRYVWWYQPDGSTKFLNTNTQFGYLETRENYQGPPPLLQIGSIKLEWSVGGEGHGWVYYGPSSSPSLEYELALTNHISISNVDAGEADFKLPMID